MQSRAVQSSPVQSCLSRLPNECARLLLVGRPHAACTEKSKKTSSPESLPRLIMMQKVLAGSTRLDSLAGSRRASYNTSYKQGRTGRRSPATGATLI